jgi:uncharacterized protein YyaL (SSP411 family)
LKHTNRLIHSLSPYLLQHAHNPVDWQTWSEEAWAQAKKEDKLVIVSIGYAACHWCHVMEHECFEDEETAELMNQRYICIKVDREERPDVDAVYMDACQLITQRGGWPLNVFCLPDGRPIHAGTYFPKPQWNDMLVKLSVFYQNKSEEAEVYAQRLQEGVKQMDLASIAKTPSMNEELIIDQTFEKWQTMFDPVLGGYNWSPKFPMPSNYSCLIHLHSHICNPRALHQIENTLNKMALGGIYDQLGGGFARYSVDAEWKIPHFEKMLYDNAQLLSIYSKAYRLTKNNLYKKTVFETIEFLQRELMHNNGLFFSALDADSEGVEGKYYIWKKSEIEQILGKDAVLFNDYFRVDKEALWEDGENNLLALESIESFASNKQMPTEEIQNLLDSCRTKLLEKRNKRVKPSLDDKVVCSWNALLITGLCEAYQTFGDINVLNLAVTLCDTLLDKLYINNILYRIWKDDQISTPAFAEDYGTLAEALISMYQITLDEKYLTLSKKILEQSIDLFYNNELGFFKMKSKNDTPLFADKIDIGDDVIPSANSIFAHVLYKLGFYFSNQTYINMSVEMVNQVKGKFTKFPTGYSNWLEIYMIQKFGLYQIVYTQTPDTFFISSLRNYFIPNAIYMKAGEIPLSQGKTSSEFKVYICKDFVCYEPVKNIEELISKIF